MNTVIGQTDIDISAILKKIKSNWYLFLGSAALALLMGFMLAMYLPLKYKVIASVRVKEVTNSKVVEELFEGVQLVKEKKVTADEIAILKSHSMVYRALGDLNFGVSYFKKSFLRDDELYESSPFTVELDTAMPQMINLPIEVDFIGSGHYVIRAKGQKVEIYDFNEGALLRKQLGKVEIMDTLKSGEYFNHEYLRFKLIPYAYRSGEVEKGLYYFQVNDLNRMTEAYQKKLSIGPISKDASILELKIEDKLRYKNVDFINRLVEHYVEDNYDKKNNLAVSTINFIDNQLSGVSDSLKNAETDLERSRSSINVMDLSYESKNAYNQLQELEKLRSSEIIKAKYYDYLLSYVESNSSIGDIVAPSVMGIQDPTLNTLINKLSELETDKIALSYSARSENPRLQMLSDNIQNTKKAILENVNNINVSSKITLDNINERIASIERTMDGLPQTERVLLNAQRRFDFNDNIYNYLLKKRVEASLIKASNSPTDIILDKAHVQGKKPVSPKKPLILGASLFLGIFFPLIFIFAKDLISDKVLYASDIRKLTTVPIAMEVGRNRSPRGKGDKPLSLNKACLESFRALRMKIDHAERNKTIGVSSLVKDDGKTFVALNLAMTLAMTGKKTLLVDANVHSSDLHSYLGAENAPGLNEALISGKQELGGLLVKTEVKELFLIPAGEARTGDVDLFLGRRFEELLTALCDDFDHIIIDSAALRDTSDYWALYTLLDINLFVIRKNHSPIDLAPLNEMVQAASDDSFHIVFNDA